MSIYQIYVINSADYLIMLVNHDGESCVTKLVVLQ